MAKQRETNHIPHVVLRHDGVLCLQLFYVHHFLTTTAVVFEPRNPLLPIDLSLPLTNLQEEITTWVLGHPGLDTSERNILVDKAIIVMRKMHPSRPEV